MSSTAIENSSELKKTPTNVSDAIKKLPALEQVAIQTYIAKLKSAMEDLEQEILRLQDGDDDGHAHYHGHEKCTHDHGHAHDHGEEGEKATESGHSHDHHHEKCTEDHDHGGHSHDHHHEKCTEDHDHGEHAHAHEHKNEHEHSHDHEKKEEDIPAWKKKAMAMDDDPMAAPFGGSWNMESSMDATTGSSGKVNETKSEKKEEDLPPLYESGDDFEKATNLKMEASDLKSSGDYEGALEKYTQAILAAEPSALLYANRADVLFRLKRYEACIRDCDEAVKKNPDSAKALRIRGKAKNMTGNLRDSLKDLSSSQTIDYDDDAAVMLKEVTKKVQEMDHEVVMKKVEEEEKMKKRAEEIKKAREEAEKEERERSAAAAGGGMPGMGGMDGGMPGMGGMDGGMPGMGGAGGPGGSMPGGMGGLMAALMSDPELAAGMQNPKVMAAFQDLMSSPGGAMGLMSDPSKLQKLMEDPEVGPFLQKLMGKLGPMMGGMGGGMPPGGMGGGMPPGGMGGGMDDDIPDLDDLPDLE